MFAKKMVLALGLLVLGVVLALAVAVRRSDLDALRIASGTAPVREAVPRPGSTGKFSYAGGEFGERMIDGLPVMAPMVEPSDDASNPDLLAAFADYVLVGRVERRVGTRYPDSLPYPTTDYEVAILEVIKGNINAGQDVPITKRGGILEDGSYIMFVYKDDFMLEAGKTYIFLLVVGPDAGELVAAEGPFSTVPLENNAAAKLKRIGKPIEPDKQRSISRILKDSKVFARYVAAVENEDAAPPDIRNRKRHKSVYEK